MKLVRTNRLATIGGLLSSLGMGVIGVPATVIISYAQIVKDGPPHWFNLLILPMVILGVVMVMVGNILTAYVAKGADEHSSDAQVAAASHEKNVEAVVKDSDVLSTPEKAAAEIARLRSLLKSQS